MSEGGAGRGRDEVAKLGRADPSEPSTPREGGAARGRDEVAKLGRADPSEPSTPREGAAPLAGIRIVDMSRLVAGNQLSLLLADFGAQVIKVEQPGVGDPLRQWRHQGAPWWWRVYGRNKQSVAIDLATDDGSEVLLGLIRGADVAVESFRPGTLERFGLTPEILMHANPRLVLARISGWGHTGEYAHRPGFGTLIEAMSGFAAMNGFADREPVLPPMALADMVAGTYGAFGVLAALRTVAASGTGQVIDLSLFEPLFAILGPQAAEFTATGHVSQRAGSRSPTVAPRNVYRAGDGQWVAVSASTQAMTERLLTAIDREDLRGDPRFADNEHRLRNVDALDEAIGAAIGSRTLADNLAHFEQAGVTAGPVCDISQLLPSSYFATRGVVVDGPAPHGGHVPMHAVTPRLSRTPGAVSRPAPDIGQHTDEILEPVIGEARLGELRASGVVA